MVGEGETCGDGIWDRQLIALLLIVLLIAVMFVRSKRVSTAPFPPDLRHALSQSAELSDWIYSQLSDVELRLDGNHARKLSCACFYVVLSHFDGIRTLLANGCFASAFALARSQVDAYARGMWLAYVATPEQVENIVAHGDPPNIGRIIAALEADGSVLEPGVLSGIKNAIWGILSDYAHTGIRQISRQFMDDQLLPNYDESELLECLRAAEHWAMIAAGSLAECFGHEAIAAIMRDRLRDGR